MKISDWTEFHCRCVLVDQFDRGLGTFCSWHVGKIFELLKADNEKTIKDMARGIRKERRRSTEDRRKGK